MPLIPLDDHLADGGLDFPGKVEVQKEFKVELTPDQEHFFGIIKRVIDSGKHNYEGERIPVNNKWNIDLLTSLLTDYHDQQVIDFITFGFPICRNEDHPLEMGGRNHKGATEFEQQIDDYIANEIKLGATLGPFENIPFRSPVTISPLSSRPKKGTGKCRIIMDCSWPIGFSLNDGMEKDSYMGQSISLKYPTVDTLARKVHELSESSGEDILFFKEDLDRAFRQIYGCPLSVPLLGYRWRNLYYFDTVLVMGCRIAPYICQRVTNMITYIHKSMAYYLLNYVDDFIGAEPRSRIHRAHEAFIRLLRDLHIDRSPAKSIAHTQVIEWIGTLFNSRDMTIGITPQRKIEVLNELNRCRWKAKTMHKEVGNISWKIAIPFQLCKTR